MHRYGMIVYGSTEVGMERVWLAEDGMSLGII
jgi:hypothetical protein